MKCLIIASLLPGLSAFSSGPSSYRLKTSHSFGNDPRVFNEFPQFSDVKDAFPTLGLADAVAEVSDAAASAPVSDDNGWFGFLTAPIEGLLQVCHSVLGAVGLNENSWGISILVMTVAIKALTYPLTKQQLESTNKMQVLQPQIKEIQAKYQSNPEVMNQKISEFYQANEMNPLAGCIPSLVQIPIFIGLYRAVLQLAKDDKLNEPFLWLPNLEGPTYGADPSHANEWITKGWVDGVPSLGWEDTTAFLILPAFLAISQVVSMEVMKPQPGPDGKEPAEQPAFLKALPLLFAWFSLNVPAALTIYWAANSILSTATSLYLKSQFKAPVTVSSSSNEISSTFATTKMREAPTGFASAFDQDPEMKPITASEIVDAELVEMNNDQKVVAGSGIESETPKRGGSKKKKKKKKKRRS